MGSRSKAKNIFVVGLNAFNRRQLATIRDARDYRFHGLLAASEVDAPERFCAHDLLDRARARLRTFPGRVDAIVGYYDFPVSTMLPILRREMNLPTPSLESVLRCEHKFWSRLEQQRCIPGHIPEFVAVDPFDAALDSDPPLAFPFWIKPVKSLGSYLGFRITDHATWRHALRALRGNVGRIGEPFEEFSRQADLPTEVASTGGCGCIAETMLSGRQCTLEGYVFRGEVQIFGVVDSIRHANRTTFGRYQYPSRLPLPVQRRMADVARRVLERVGYDDAPFNIEMFYDSRQDHVWLLEINTRGSQSHCPLFQMVDGRSHQEVMVEVAIGRRPEFPHRKGRYRRAAKFMLRRYQDARVARAPTSSEVREMERQVPGALCQVYVRKGTVLSHLKEQDSYSYELAAVFVGGQSQQELFSKYERCLSLLPFEFERVPQARAAA